MARSTLAIQPLTAAIGAEITGVDLRKPLDDGDLAAVRQALLDHLVIFVRDQDIGLADQVRFSEYFGSISPGKGTRVTDNVAGVNVLDQVAPKGQGADDWHSDHMFLPEPPMGTTLRAVQLPTYGGDTCFTSMYAAYMLAKQVSPP